MKITSAFLACFICIQLYACDKYSHIQTGNDFSSITNTDTMKLKVIIGSANFTATLLNNTSVAAFKAKLPMTINMKELNGNEKFYDLPDNMPRNASNPGTIQTGDLMLYGTNTLVLFYKTFSTSYSYTRLGRIDNTSGLAVALGSGNVTVKLELE